MNCLMCEKEIDGEYFEGVNGEICGDCLKTQTVYYALKSMNLIKNKEE